MGKTPQPLTILVAQAWLTRPEVQELATQGHDIQVAPPADLILAPWAHAWTEDMFHAKLLPLALKRARARKKDGKK